MGVGVLLVPVNTGIVHVKFRLVHDESGAVHDNFQLSPVNCEIVLDNAETFSPNPWMAFHTGEWKIGHHLLTQKKARSSALLAFFNYSLFKTSSSSSITLSETAPDPPITFANSTPLSSKYSPSS